MGEVLSVAVLFAGKLALASMVSKATFRSTRWRLVPLWLSAYLAGAMLVAVLWALSGVK